MCCAGGVSTSNFGRGGSGLPSNRALSNFGRWPGYSALKTLGTDDLKDQLKGYKLKGKSGFTLTQANRAAYVLQVQSLMSEMLGEGSNDLADGDSGVEGRGVRRRKESDNHEAGHKAKKSKSKVKTVSYKGWEWCPNQKFEIEKLIGKMISSGEVPGRANVKAGTVNC